MKTLFISELNLYLKRMGFLLLLLLFLGIGFFAGSKLSFNASESIYKNSPYSIMNMIGFLSLISIFTTTILAAQHLFKEKEHHFELILYATPLQKFQYAGSRFGIVFFISLFYFLAIVCGCMLAHAVDPDHMAYDIVHPTYYINAVLILAIPNLFFCSALVCSVAWLIRNKLLVYVTGLFIYILYMVTLLFSGSPLMAGNLPPSAESMELSAAFDPFGLSAFYLQTLQWTSIQRNTALITLTGKLFANRAGYVLFSVSLLFLSYKRFRLQADEGSGNPVRKGKASAQIISHAFTPVVTCTEGSRYFFQTLGNRLRLYFKFVTRSIPFMLICIILLFYMSMEIYSAIDQGIRLPMQYGSSGLMANRMVSDLPMILLMMLIFYAFELFWLSKSHHMDLIEHSTGFQPLTGFIAQWLSLNLLIVMLTFLIGTLAIVFQFIYRYPFIEWGVYLSAIGFICIPLFICSGLLICIHSLFRNKWAGLIVSIVVLLLLTTSLGKNLGLMHPMFRFAAGYSSGYSDMDGWGNYPVFFYQRMVFGICVLLFVVTAIINFNYAFRQPYQVMAMIAFFISSVFSGNFIYTRYATTVNETSKLNQAQRYEQCYKVLQNIPQPAVTKVKTYIVLFPEHNAYHITGVYTLQNKTKLPVHHVLVNFDPSSCLKEAAVVFNGNKTNVSASVQLIKLDKPMEPGDSGRFTFSFDYTWKGNNRQHPFQVITGNGSFMRISNYFPRLGYQPDYELTDEKERRKRKMGPATPITSLEAPRVKTDPFINLDMLISTSGDQTAIGVGELVFSKKIANRNYFRYKSTKPVSFRFGISSARYAVKKDSCAGKRIEIFYHPTHSENVDHLVENVKRTLRYCQQNFSPYPYEVIRFAEVSSNTYGFAATAYPATIFVTEHMVFHANINKEEDVINELAAHELSHQWWGTDQLVPDDREGATLLTETLAMYTELMIAKHYSGEQRVHNLINMHENMYLNEAGFSEEQPLYKMKPEHTHLAYSKGVVAMHLLEKLIGEKKINQALKNLLKKHTGNDILPVSTDLLQELYNVSDPALHSKIDSLFKQTGIPRLPGYTRSK